MNRTRLALYCLLPAAALAAAAGAQDAAQPLPLRDVVLFSSGVGYFHRAGRVQGDAVVPLSLRSGQMNDILKSLVLFDPQGTVRPVTYAAGEPGLRQPGGPVKDLNPTLSLGSLLRQFQGARVRAEVGGESPEGRIISVSLKPIPAPGKEGPVVQVEVLNLLTDAGLRSIPLEQITSIRLLDEKLNRELHQSLERLGSGADDTARTVELRFAGAGAREVQAGYLQEMPVWKTSYRLVLEQGKAPYLQGWAHVENTTEEDWQNVRLSLVSGRPVSFIQDLYQPLYIPRPIVQAQVIGSPNPQTYGEVLDSEALKVAEGKAGAMGGGLAGGGFGGLADKAAAPPAPAARPERRAGQRARGTGQPAPAEEPAPDFTTELAQSIASQAEGTERGALFEYAIKQPVTLAKGQAAMVPIASAPVEGEQLAIFDADATSRHALAGFRLKNTTGLHLSGGPVTVFREGVYAGDAQITHLQPGEDRLLSYAVDLDLVADVEEPRFRQDTLSVTAKSGVLHITRKQQRERTYTFRNKSDAAKTVLVQQNQEPEFKLALPARAFETTQDEHRFRLEVPAGKTETLKVVTERPVTETVALLDADLNFILAHAQNAQLSEKLRAALKELAARRRAITALQAQRTALENEIKEIGAEQERIRKNMEQLDRNSPLYGQYVKKLTEQEARIEALRAQIARLREQEMQAQQELRQYVETITAD